MKTHSNSQTKLAESYNFGEIGETELFQTYGLANVIMRGPIQITKWSNGFRLIRNVVTDYRRAHPTENAR